MVSKVKLTANNASVSSVQSKKDAEHYKFKELRIAVITQRDDRGDQLIRELQKTRAEVQHIWPPPQYIPSDYDIVYSDLMDNLPS